MKKKRWVDVWVCRDMDGTVSVWKYGNRCPYWTGDERYSWFGTDGLLRDEDPDQHGLKCWRSDGWFSRTYGPENLPKPGKRYNCILEM